MISFDAGLLFVCLFVCRERYFQACSVRLFFKTKCVEDSCVFLKKTNVFHQLYIF